MATETAIAPEFTVDPREGTVVGPGGTVRLEPKVMEVLSVLSRQPGRVVSREELLDAVWPDVVVTEHTLSRCIYQLRHELGRISNDPDLAEFNPIETLPKRGYRLLANLQTMPGGSAMVSPDPGAGVQTIPFIVGQWVRGDRFYGRASQINEILEGHRNNIWLLGTRRIGKTSLLKQIELIAGSGSNPRYFPVFWDFQGADTAEELHLNFVDALLDSEDRLKQIGIDPQDIQGPELFASLDRLRRRLRDRKLKLLLLCDEVEELLKLQQNDPSLLRKLRHLMQSREDIRTVLASTIRLWALAEQKEDTSPFLHGFTPPLYISRLSDEEARSLIEQSHLGPAERPRFAEDLIDSIHEHCDNHPYLMQLVCKRYLETQDLEEAIKQVATDRMVSYFFSVDFDMLSATEGDIIRLISRQTTVSSESLSKEVSLGPDALEGTLRRLENLGFVRRNSEGQFELSNYFFRRWLEEEKDRTITAIAASPTSSDSDAEQATREPDGGHSADGFIGELKRRSVFRVGIAYMVVAWVLLQLGEISFEFLEVPGWAGKLLIVFLVLGLPVALILAWAFELTPEGVKRDKDVDRSTPSARQSGHKLDYVIMAILAIAVLLFALDRFA